MIYPYSDYVVKLTKADNEQIIQSTTHVSNGSAQDLWRYGKMDLERYTQKAQQAILAAQQIAQDMHHATIEPEHLLFALVRQSEGVVPAIVNRIAGSSQLLADELEKELGSRPKMHGGNGQVGVARATAKLLASSENQAMAMKDDYVSTEHILLAFAAGPEADRLRQFGITPDSILHLIDPCIFATLPIFSLKRF